MVDNTVPALLLVGVVVLAGCSSFVPPIEEIGREGGVDATDTLAITESDGLNASERKQVVSRTMARVETIRNLEFTDDVPVRVISRAEFHNGSTVTAFTGGRPAGWTEQVWEALWIVDEQTNASAEIDDVYAGAVLGYYSDGAIVIVSDSPTPRIDPYTLAHELTHALQDQRLSLSYATPTMDRRLAANGLIEGDANVVESAYRRHCTEEWSCLSRPDRPPSLATPTDGIYRTIIMPYVQGPRFVQALRSDGGWEAVDRAYERVPNSTEQIVHPDQYPTDQPATVRVETMPAGDWERFETTPAGDTIGEAAIFTMARTNGLLDPDSSNSSTYSAPVSSGWAGDRLVPFRQAGGENGYVWKLVWESPADARAFTTAYRSLLDRSGGQPTGDGTVVLSSGPYADAFRIERVGSTVRIVNGPTRQSVEELAPAPLAPA